MKNSIAAANTRKSGADLRVGAHQFDLAGPPLNLAEQSLRHGSANLEPANIRNMKQPIRGMLVSNTCPYAGCNKRFVNKHALEQHLGKVREHLVYMLGNAICILPKIC